MFTIYKNTEVRKCVFDHTLRNFALHFIGLLFSDLIFHQETYQITSTMLIAILLISLCIALYESFCFQEKMVIKTRYLFRHMLFILPVLTFECLLFYWLKWYDSPWLLALIILLIDVVIILIEAHHQQSEKSLYANALKQYQDQIALKDNSVL